MDHMECVITYPVSGHEENVLKSVIRLGINKIILMDENKSYINSFNRFGLITDVKPILTDDVSSVISSVGNLISDAKKKYDGVCVLLLPSDPVISTGIYIASCMEKVKIVAPTSDLEIQCLTMPVFPFVNLNEKERFILAKVIEKREISRKNLSTIVKREGYSNKLCPKGSDEPTVKERCIMRQIQRTLDKLEKMELLTKEKRSKHFIWKPTTFGKLLFKQGNRRKY